MNRAALVFIPFIPSIPVKEKRCLAWMKGMEGMLTFHWFEIRVHLQKMEPRMARIALQARE